MAAKVSVIVPNYNHSRYLRQRIDSILNQTYQDFELILMDDKSTDDSVSILNSYASHPRVAAIVINDENSGSTFKQWKKGLSLCKGKYVWIAESDDWAAPRLLEACVSALESDPEVSLCQVGAHVVDGDGKEMSGPWCSNLGVVDDTDGSVTYIDGKELIRRFLRWRNVIYNASGVVFRRDCVKQFPESICNFRKVGDWAFWCGIANCGRVALVHEKLNYFRRHETSVTAHADWGEELRFFKWEVDSGIFKLGKLHDSLVRIGILQRHIKHIEDERERTARYKELEDITGEKGKLPYRYMLFMRLADRVSPICLYPMNKKRLRLR